MHMTSDWEGALGHHEDRDIQKILSLQRLNNPAQVRDYDTSSTTRSTSTSSSTTSSIVNMFL